MCVGVCATENILLAAMENELSYLYICPGDMEKVDYEFLRQGINGIMSKCSLKHALSQIKPLKVI